MAEKKKKNKVKKNNKGSKLYPTTIDLTGIVQLRIHGTWIDVGDDAEWVRCRTKEEGRPMLALTWVELSDSGVRHLRMLVLGKEIEAYRLHMDVGVQGGFI